MWEAAETQINNIKNTNKRKTAEKNYTNNIKIKIKTAVASFTYLFIILFL